RAGRTSSLARGPSAQGTTGRCVNDARVDGSVAADARAPVLDGDAALGDESDGLGHEAAFRGLHAGRERVGGVVLEDRDGLLEEDRAGVVAVVGEVDGGAGDLHAGGQDGLVHAAAVHAAAAEGGD